MLKKKKVAEPPDTFGDCPHCGHVMEKRPTVEDLSTQTRANPADFAEVGTADRAKRTGNTLPPVPPKPPKPPK